MKPADRPTATCDWGDCDGPSVDWRFSDGHGWLPVCHAHRNAGWRKVLPDTPAYRVGVRWIINAPDGSEGSIREGTHVVTEHEDGTITVDPSLVMPSGWHGWLRRGVFTDA